MQDANKDRGRKSGERMPAGLSAGEGRLLSLRILGWRRQGAPAVSAGDRIGAEEGCVLALFPGRIALQQAGRIPKTADPGTQFRFAAGGQGQDEAAVFAVFDLLVGGPDALPYIIGGTGGHTDAERSRFVPGQAKPPCSSSSRL